MSHFTRIKTQLRDGEVLRKVLCDMGHKPENAPDGGTVQVRGWGGQTRKAEFKVPVGNFDIGFARTPEGYEMTADFYGMPLDSKRFVEDLNRRYAREVVVASAEAEGFRVVEELRQPDGSVKLVVERWV